MENKFIFWLIITIIGLCFSVIGFLIKALWGIVFDEIRKWKKNIDDTGGVVTRDKFFEWCKEKQSKCSEEVSCRLCEIEEWRKDMYEKGGPLTAQGHEGICDRVTTKAANVFISKLEDSLKHFQELAKKDQAILMGFVKETVAEAVKQIKAANGQK